MRGFFKRLSWHQIATYVIWDLVAIATWEAVKWLYCMLWALWCS